MPYIPIAKIIIPKEKPKNLEELLKLLFPNHPERQKLAKMLLEHIHNAEKRKRGFHSEEWLEFILGYLDNRELTTYYQILVEKQLPRTEIHRKVEKKAKELGIPFGTTKTNYNIVIKTLQNAQMIYKSRRYYRTTKKFGELLYEVAKIWNKWIEEGR